MNSTSNNRGDNGRGKPHSTCNNEDKILRNKLNKKCAKPM